ncbi:MAG: hypothetical protein PSX37_07685 [bacterium]|nr:hypothetical protein [bacterium]
MPLIWSGDSVEYGVVATTFYQTGTLGPINAWRMPGYSVLLGLGLHVATIEQVVTVLHTLCGITAALAAGALAARALPRVPLAGPIVCILVGIDPIGIMYERMVLTEAITSASFMLATWLTTLAVERVRWSAAYGLIAASVLVLALASLVRSNMQVFLVLLPVIAMVARARRDRVWRTGGTLAAAFVVAALVIGPRISNMSAAYGTKTLAIGTGFTRMFGLTDASLIELNNASAFTPTQWKSAVDRSQQPWFTGYELLNCINANSRLAPRYAHLKPWAAADAASAELADETVRRHGPSTLLYSTRAFTNLLGFPIGGGSMFRENKWWFQRFAPNPPAIPALTSWWDDPAGFAHLDQAKVQALATGTRRPIDVWSRSSAAKVFNGWNTAIQQIRPLIAAGSLLGLFLLVFRGKRALAFLLATPIIHHAVLAFHLFSGIDRYAAPFYPVMWVAFAAVFAACRNTPEATHEATGESVGVATTGAERPEK